MTVPPGFALHRDGRIALLARRDLLEPLKAAGWDRPSTWERLVAGAAGPGRGGAVAVDLPAGPRGVVKRLRRGGLAAPLWRDRFPGRRRLFDNVGVPLEAARRGVPTASPLALLVRSGAPGLFEGWLCVEEIGGAVDLRTRLSRLPPPPREELGAALGAVRRMHEAGVEHRDLNLGNVLVGSANGGFVGYVIDLDRARLHDGALALGLRRAGLERLERSWLKVLGDPGPFAEGPGLLRELYAAGDAGLHRALSAGRAGRRVRFALHRLGWRR